MVETSPYATQMGSNQKRSTSKKKIVKTRNKMKKPRALFEELSFVEDHQETFYKGLNENVMGAFNPITAKTISIDNAADLVKNWVNPDCQLSSRSATKKAVARKSVLYFDDPKIKALTFLEDEIESNYPYQNAGDLKDIQEQVFENHEYKSPERAPRLIDNLFDTINGTQMLDQTLLTPRNHNVFVLDTPVEYYGLSILERQKRGLNF